MSFWIGVGVLVLGLIVSIGLHELGHLIPAKRFGVYVPQYFIGFGPTLWSKRVGDTEYGVKALPLGGYVRLVGMFPPKEATKDPTPASRDSWFSSIAQEARVASQSEIKPGMEHRAFYALSVPKKIVVMAGGPIVNLLLAIVLFAIVISGFGTMNLTNKLGNISECVTEVGEECTPSDPIAPAVAAGLQPGDRVISWGGETVNTWEDISGAIRAGGGAPAAVVIERDGEHLTLTVTPVITPRPVINDEGQVVTDDDGELVLADGPFVGVGPAYEMVPQPLSAVPPVIGEVLGGTAKIVMSLPSRLVSIGKAVFTDEERDPSIIGLIGVGRFAGEIASIPAAEYGLQARTADMLSLLASLNIALFVFNMIPLLPLDGGHIAGALYEGGRRRLAGLFGKRDPGFADTAKLMPLTYVVFIGLIGMSVLLAVADIVKPVTLG